ncbi:MAG: sigma-70 family RNA polymerase sigma factor [Planctomycetota bacterium]|nr:sigma-70 family RNA polymerase sigma factor [Planctomycetota bacterium]
MSEQNKGSITHFFELLRDGDGSVAAQLWERFFPRLLGLARKTLADRPQRVADAEDAVQSAFVAFWQQAERGDLAGELHRDNLWNLLGVITVRKALKQVQREQTKRKGGGNVRGESWFQGPPGMENEGAGLDNALGELPTQEFDLIVEEMLLQLDDDLRMIALLKLMGYQDKEIADMLDCVERTVRRRTQLIRAIWKSG